MKTLTHVAPRKPGSRRIVVRRLLPVPVATIPGWNERVRDWMAR